MATNKKIDPNKPLPAKKSSAPAQTTPSSSDNSAGSNSATNTGLTLNGSLFPKVASNNTAPAGKMPSDYWRGYQTPQDYWDAKYDAAVQKYLGIEDKIFGTGGVASDRGIGDVKQYKQLSSQLLQAQNDLLSLYKQGSSEGFPQGQGSTVAAPIINGDYIEKLIQHSKDLSSNAMDKSKVGSPEYKAAQGVYNQIDPNLKTVQATNQTNATQQKTTADAKAAAATAAATAAKLPKLEEDLQRAKDKGQDTTAIEAQIAAVKAATATHTPDVQPTNATGPVTPTTTATTTSGPSAAGPTNTATTTGGTYKTVKGVLQYQDNPFTGEYQGKYYSNGKLETPAQIKADFMSKYGEQAKFIASVPELSNLLSTAISQNWAPTRWTTEFANTQWAQQHPGDIGLAEIKRVSAPEQYNTDYNAAYSKAVALANQLGIKLTPAQLGAQVTDIKQAPGSVDQNAVNSGQDVTTWILQHPNASDQQITQFMAQHGTLDPQAKGGTIAAQSTQLAQLAQQYGVYGQYSPDGKDTSFFDKYALNMAQGAVGYDPNTAEQQFKTAAINTYKPFADQIAGGAKVSDLASPYVNTLSSLLEINPADIQLGATTGYGAMIGKALMGDGAAPVDPYTFASQVRSQPEWLNTQNAHSTLLSAGNQLIAKMGF